MLFRQRARESDGAAGSPFVAFALVLCYWSALAFAHSREPSRVAVKSREAGEREWRNVVARLAAMPRLANPFRWDCVFETDRAMYRFRRQHHGRQLYRPPCSLRQTRRRTETGIEFDRAAKTGRRCSSVLRGFQSRNSKIPVALPKLSFNWPTCVTLSRADRAAVFAGSCRSIVRRSREDERNERVQ